MEQNYEYDLRTSEKLMEKYIGKKVRLYQGNATYQEARHPQGDESSVDGPGGWGDRLRMAFMLPILSARSPGAPSQAA